MDVVIRLVLIIIISVIFHELGHYTMAILLKYNPKFILKQGNPCVHIDRFDSKGLILISLAGIIIGYIILEILLNFFSYESNMIWYTNVAYVLSCWADFKNIYLLILSKYDDVHRSLEANTI